MNGAVITAVARPISMAECRGSEMSLDIEIEIRSASAPLV
jgi:hypothetical protein